MDGGKSGRGGLDGLIARLNPEQREAACLEGGQGLVLAPAGTGKTQTMAVRVAWLIGTGRAAPGEVLALTFTDKAARELRTRIGAAIGRESMPRAVGTFHAVGLDILRANPGMAGLKKGFEIADEEKTLAIVKAAMAKAGIPAKRKNRFSADPVKQVADKVARMKDDGFRPSEAAAWLARFEADHPADADGIAAARSAAAVAEAVAAGFKRRNLCDFSDMILWPTLALEQDARFRAEWAGRFRHVVIDEYQDVNDIQYRFAKASASVHGNLMAVGDDDQNLYSFRGSSPAYILRFTEDFPEAQTITLFRNYRSTQAILDAATRLIVNNECRHPKEMVSALEGHGDPVTALECRDPQHEAEAVVRAIVTRAPDIPLDRCAVLYRSAYQGRAIEDALRKQGVGYGVVGGTSFYRRKEVLDALALLSLAEFPDSPATDDAFRRVANTPSRGVGPSAIRAVEEEAARLGSSLFVAAQSMVAAGDRAAQGGLADFVLAMEEANFVEGGGAELIRALLASTGYDAMLSAQGAQGRERRENLDELCALSDRFADTFTFVEHCAAAAREAETASEFGQVQLTTIHGAKGLEYDLVAVIGCAETQFPSARSVKEGRVEEERRLAYVAITRARRACLLTWPRRGDGRRTASEPSRFVLEAVLPEHVSRLEEPFRAPRGRQRRSGRGGWKKAAPKAAPARAPAAAEPGAAPAARPAARPRPAGDAAPSPKESFWGRRG
jgi:DNA helicase-2/ATP-dependent DNA helicase PcrA